MSRVNFIILVICALALSFSASGCKSLDNSMLSPKTKNAELLPPLEPVFDVESFGTVFPIVQTTGSASYDSFTRTASYSGGTYTNSKLRDFNTIFQRNVEGNICVPDLTGQKKGAIKCSLIDGNVEGGGYGCIPVSILSLGILNLLGMPFWKEGYNLQIEVIIFDRNNKLIGKYTSDYYKQVSWIAMYWGYELSDAQQHSARVAFTECMEDIKQQIAKDYNKLNNALR